MSVFSVEFYGDWIDSSGSVIDPWWDDVYDFPSLHDAEAFCRSLECDNFPSFDTESFVCVEYYLYEVFDGNVRDELHSWHRPQSSV